MTRGLCRYDSEAKISDDDENVDEKEQQSKSKKRKANPKSTKPPAKKRKEVNECILPSIQKAVHVHLQ